MGIAVASWWYAASFRRRCDSGVPTIIRMRTAPDGTVAAVDAQGMLLFTLEHGDDGGFRMLDSQGHMALVSLPAEAEGEATVEDRTGRQLTQLRRQRFVWDGRTYAWKAELLGFTTFELREVGPDAPKRALAVLRLQVDGGGGELSAAPIDAVPLGLLIFQALILEHQWASLRGSLAPIRALKFSTKWS